jgi:chloride channel 7
MRTGIMMWRTMSLCNNACIIHLAVPQGATRMTISITVLVMETTGSMQLIIPLMLTIFFAKAIGDRYSHGRAC